jgi:hypothetical protein
MVGRIFMVSKTGRGLYITPFGMRRKALHKSKRGGSLLLSPGLGASDGGVSLGSGMKTGGEVSYEKEKPVIENIQKRLETLSIKGGKRKNVSFRI